MPVQEPKRPANAPTLLSIYARVARANTFENRIPQMILGLLFVPTVIAIGLGPQHTTAWLLGFVVAAGALAALHWRWWRNARRLSDVHLFMRFMRPRLLTDERDLGFMTWIQWRDPKIERLLNLQNRTPTNLDMVRAMVQTTADDSDAGWHPPYCGDTERCADDTEARRARERASRATI